MEAFDMVTDYGLDALAAVLHETAKEKGFWDEEINYNVIGNKLALVHSEVTEVLEAIRKNKGSENTVEEMADVIIRLLDLYAAMMSLPPRMVPAKGVSVAQNKRDATNRHATTGV